MFTTYVPGKGWLLCETAVNGEGDQCIQVVDQTHSFADIPKMYGYEPEIQYDPPMNLGGQVQPSFTYQFTPPQGGGKITQDLIFEDVEIEDEFFTYD